MTPLHGVIGMKPMSRPLDVLVVGAGPTGLTMACELRHYGLSCRIVDQADAPSGIPKAVAVRPRTVEVFDIMGLDEEFVANGRQVQGFNVYAGGQRLVHLTMDGMPTRYSYMLTLPQSETERLLTKRLSDLGVEVERSVQFANVAQQEDGITATLRHANATTDTVQARWLIGCDGAHSAVRKALGLPFEGARYEESFLLAYVRIEERAPVDEVRAFFTPDGPVGLLPLPQGRHYVILPLFKETAETDRTTVSLDELKTFLAQRGMASLRILEAFWITKFRIHRRIVPSLRVGRVFLCGDSAHIHSPAGGQGMNLGIQDAFNLAWKLALVRNYRKTPMVGEYHRGFLGVVTGVHATAEPPGFSEWRKFVAAPAAGDRAPDGNLSVRGTGVPVRLFELLRPGRHVLLLFAGRGTTPARYRKLEEIEQGVRARYRDLIAVHLVVPQAAPTAALRWDGSRLLDAEGELHRQYGAGYGCLYLIRPDGYVGYRSQPADDGRLTAYLQTML